MPNFIMSIWNQIISWLKNPSTLLTLAVIVTICVLIGLLPTISKWKLYTKAGYPGWAIFIPYYNDYVFVRIAGLPWWSYLIKLLLEYIFPGVEIFLNGFVTILVASAFGKDIPFGLGMTFLPVIFYPLLAFGKSTFLAPNYLSKSSWLSLFKKKVPELHGGQNSN